MPSDRTAELVTVSTRCITCGGSGEMPRAAGAECHVCEGWGTVRVQVPKALSASPLALAAAQLRGVKVRD